MGAHREPVLDDAGGRVVACRHIPPILAREADRRPERLAEIS